MALRIVRRHSLGPAAVRTLLDDLARELAADLQLRHRWEADRLVFERTGLRGHIALGDGLLEVVLRKSRLLPVSEAWLQQQVERRLDEHL